MLSISVPNGRYRKVSPHGATILLNKTLLKSVRRDFSSHDFFQPLLGDFSVVRMGYVRESKLMEFSVSVTEHANQSIVHLHISSISVNQVNPDSCVIKDSSISFLALPQLFLCLLTLRDVLHKAFKMLRF